MGHSKQVLYDAQLAGHRHLLQAVTCQSRVLGLKTRVFFNNWGQHIQIPTNSRPGGIFTLFSFLSQTNGARGFHHCLNYAH
ncbi:MAG: hypothetical protein CM15mP120_27860 [Pseudomonadota bacterium]|nr:MAG: hypothetical protein CM15mP120_27860 [Pseudomonadota bacterium]